MARAWLLVVGVLAGCSSPPTGGERGECYGNGTCDRGLVCLSQRCVRPPGADCAAVAEHVTSLLLGNYAEPPERAALQGELVAECQASPVSVADGACLLAATSRHALAGCGRQLGVGDCAAIVAHLRALPADPQADPYLVTPIDRWIDRCRNEVPDRAFERCVRAATSRDAATRCRW